MPRGIKCLRWRTVVPKPGVYIHVCVRPKNGPRGGRTVAFHLRRTKAHAKRTHKPRVQKIPRKRKRRRKR